MRNTYHTLPEDTALFDRLRHRAYVYKRDGVCSIVGVRIRPSSGFEDAVTSADISHWDIVITYSIRCRRFNYIRYNYSRAMMEMSFRQTSLRTRYVVNVCGV